jgi:inhibitor of KinA sporulation pathway (predicted exonuclease)
VVVDARTLQLGARFQQYVRPTVHPRLTDFCTELTGITQDM